MPFNGGLAKDIRAGDLFSGRLASCIGVDLEAA